MRFDARLFSQAWLSVALVSGSDPATPVLNKTVLIEQFPTGVRLVATDRYAILRTWVSDEDNEFGDEPGPDEAPQRVAVASDVDGRAKSLLEFVHRVTGEKNYVEGTLTVRVRLDERALDSDRAPAFEGMEVGHVLIKLPDVEKVLLRAVDFAGPFPEWRKFEPQFRGETTDAIALNPEVVGRLVKLEKYHPGRPLLWRFGGRDKMALFEVGESVPYVRGAVMPMRWDFAEYAPATS